jgi:hypothetical protein
MKALLLILSGFILTVTGWLHLDNGSLITANAPRWNPFALNESGIGRTLARVLTENANTSYHHGLFEHKAPINTNALSKWLDTGTSALGFEGRLKYRPVDKYPLQPYEVKQALNQVEKDLRMAFELDPGNYTAYDVYLFFLTNNVTQTEFASEGGAQLKDDDDDSAAAADKAKEPAIKPPEAVPDSALWTPQETARRKTRAIEITDEAIRKFRPNTLDPERFLSAAVMWYNRFTILAPDMEARKNSAAARILLEEIGTPALAKMNAYIQQAANLEQLLQKQGAWNTLPERRPEFERIMTLIHQCALALATTLEHNRSAMLEHRDGNNVWGPTVGRN